MSEIIEATGKALQLVLAGDKNLIEIVSLSLRVSLTSVVIAAVIAIPMGAFLAIRDFPGRKPIIVVLNSLMGMPPVVLGLFVYLLISRGGPLGELGLLFTPTAMIIAQTLLVTPIIAALTRQTLADLHGQYDEQFRSFRLGVWRSTFTLIIEGRYSILTTILAGFGRASAEVGAVMIVGGNINHVTRVMTTTIAMETSKGDFSLALGLGMVLLAIVLSVNLLVMFIQSREGRV